MEKSLKAHERWMTAITFAEAGEWATAIDCLPPRKAGWRERLEKVFMAIAFAEEGMPEEALCISGVTGKAGCGCCETFLANLGLGSAPMKFGLVPAVGLGGQR